MCFIQNLCAAAAVCTELASAVTVCKQASKLLQASCSRQAAPSKLLLLYVRTDSTAAAAAAAAVAVVGTYCMHG